MSIRVTCGEDIYECTKAVKGDNYITLYDGDRAIVTFAGISDFSGYTIEGGDWSDPEPTSEEQLRADVDYIMAMEGIQ